MFVIIMTLSMIVWVFYTLDSYEIDSETAKMCKEVNSGDPSPEICGHLNYSSNVFRWFTALCFLTLGVLQAIYSVHLYLLDARQYLRFLITDKDLITKLNILLFLSFTSRGLYQIFA